MVYYLTTYVLWYMYTCPPNLTFKSCWGGLFPSEADAIFSQAVKYMGVILKQISLSLLTDNINSIDVGGNEQDTGSGMHFT